MAPSRRADRAGAGPVARSYGILESDDGATPVEQGKDVAVFGAIWVAAPIRRYVDAVNDIERLKSGHGFKVVKRISDPPALSDFSQFRLPDKDFEALRRCRVGHCDVKLDEPALRQLGTSINWRARDARTTTDAIIRQLALGYVNGYLAGGDGRLPVYRNQRRPTSVGGEFRDMIDRMPSLNAVPDVRRFLLEFPPAARASGSSPRPAGIKVHSSA